MYILQKKNFWLLQESRSNTLRDGLTTKEKEMALASEAAEKVDADLSAKQKEVNTI